MNTNRRFSQTSPDKANELFAKLLDTSDTAIKTRERLFTSLKEELELLASLQEQYLFPVLRRHDDMAGLVEAATTDNQETSALLEEIDRMPKGSGDFLKKVAELRKVFQQHIRDDKKELLPAVLKVLSEDEVEAVVEKVEDEMAAVEEARRAESDLRREVVSYSRDLAEAPERIRENMAAAVRTGVERSEETLHNVQDVVQTGLNATSQFLQLYSLPMRTGQDFAGQATRNLQALAQSNTVLARGMQDVSEEWIGLAQERLQKNIDSLSALTRCRSLAELMEAQGAMLRNNLTQMLENSRRIVALSSRVANEASFSLSAPQETRGSKDNRAA
ncbi:phasin family protein [Microvirga subterranea]|uniref:Hemerythrin HHE cation binding domain-containing protein n=1 Tax=Microvirga subterranea TaxID=186651 RepID=A0A370HRH7_9HYPH|nr:phasin family protein [Microvirga subterranea]RDI61152.1 hemerythrin HHE cation binding domain-containing protein [Microvirga subterranea]